MQMKKEIVMELVKGENTYRFSMPEAAPLGEIYDVGFQILKSAIQLAANSVAQNEAQVLAQQLSAQVEQPLSPTSNCDSVCPSQEGGA